MLNNFPQPLSDQQLIWIANHMARDKYIPPAKRALLVTNPEGTQIIDHSNFPVTIQENGDVVIEGKLFPIVLHQFVQHVLEPRRRP